MYVCICNALTDREIIRAIGNGIEDPTEIYASLGCEPQCGKCLPTVHDLVRQHRVAAADAPPCALAVLSMAAE